MSLIDLLIVPSTLSPEVTVPKNLVVI